MAFALVGYLDVFRANVMSLGLSGSGVVERCLADGRECQPAMPEKKVLARHLSNADVDSQAAALTYRDWDQHYDQLSPGCFIGTIEEYRFSAFTLVRETSNRMIWQRGALPKGFFSVGALLSSQGDEYYYCGEILTAGSTTMLKPQQSFELRTPEIASVVAAVFSPEALLQSLDETSIDPHEMEVDLMRMGNLIGESDQISGFMQRLYHTAESDPTHILGAEVQLQIGEEFLGLVTEMLSAGVQSSRRMLCPHREKIVQRFRQYLAACPEAALNIAEICAEIGVTRRTLQNATQQVFGVSPQHYLKAVRLNGLRRALKVRQPQHESIGDVAARWGFWHLSQMAKDYRHMFGELPSQTPCIHLS